MAKFLTGNELNSEVEKIFEGAEERIILISPFIKLHDRFISTLRAKKENDKLEVVIVFGKNEDDLSKSMKQDDFNFFKEFPNIQIRYEKRLHAKYYANETSAILTSMNLYSFSQDNNIEAGVMTKVTLMGSLANNLMTNVTGEDSFDRQAGSYFSRVIEQSDLLFQRTPQYESALFGLTQKYKGSKTEVDKLSDFFGGKKVMKSDFTMTVSDQRPTEQMGYCIKTKARIPFDVSQPFSAEALKEWNKKKDKKETGVYCHYSGELTHGKNSKERPVLNKYWREAQAKFNITA